MIIKTFAFIGILAVLLGVGIFVSNLYELFERVDTLEQRVSKLEKKEETMHDGSGTS